MNEHVASLFIDYFLKVSDFQGAAKISTVVMQQEMFDSNFLNFLSVFSLLKWTELPHGERIFEPRVHHKREPDPDLSGEDVVIFRIPFLKNDFFDGHLDLDDPDMLVGKSLEWFSMNLKLPNSDESVKFIDSINFIGKVLQMQYETCAEIIKNKKIFPVAHKFTTDFFKNIPEATDNIHVQEILKLSDFGDFTPVKQLSIVVYELYQPIFDAEKNNLANLQEELLVRWDEYRLTFVKAQAEKFNINIRLNDILKRQNDLAHEQNVLYFFENRVRLEDSAQQKIKLWEELKLLEKKGAETEDDYAQSLFDTHSFTKQGKIKKLSNTVKSIV